MIVTLAVVVLCASIVAFFAQEFARLIKRMAAIPGVTLLLPLLFVSFLLEVYEEFGLSFLLWVQSFLHHFAGQLASILPFETVSLSIIKIILLFLIAGLSIIATRERPALKRDYSTKPLSYWIGLALWLLAAILFSLPKL